MGVIARENVREFPLELQWGKAERHNVCKPLSEKSITA
jgi:hypothetical protein